MRLSSDMRSSGLRAARATRALSDFFFALLLACFVTFFWAVDFFWALDWPDCLALLCFWLDCFCPGFCWFGLDCAHEALPPAKAAEMATAMSEA